MPFKTLSAAEINPSSLLVNLLIENSPESKSHSKRTKNICRRFAQLLTLTAEETADLLDAALLHDIGKLYIDSEVLRKKARLSDEERLILAEHPLMGARLAEHEGFRPAVVEAVLHHHERWDGQGYPARLQKSDIPLLARIIFLADTFDTIVSNRPYDPPRSVLVAMQEIERCAGEQFDPEMSELFLRYLARQHERVLARAKETQRTTGTVTERI